MESRILIVIFLIFSVAAAIQIFYYYYFYLAPFKYKSPENNKPDRPVSVIICARNEAGNLKNFLPSVLEQDYPDYEVIVVNDCSEDDTYIVLGEYLKKYPHLRVSTIYKDPKFTHSKKLAQLIGIKAAKNEVLLFTDADCRPRTNRWLRGMTSNFDEKTTFVLGYGAYMKEKGLLNTYIRCDTVFIAMQYFGMAIRGIPYMGVGRNLAYIRSEFFLKKGFGMHSHLASGDDDLFVNSNANPWNTRVEIRPETHTLSLPSSTAHEWIKQKKRHLTTAPYYKEKDKFLLVTEPLTRMIFYSSFIFLLTHGFFWIQTVAIFCARLIMQVSVYSRVHKKLEESGLVTFSVIFDIFSPVINGILFLGNKGKVRGMNQWN